MFLLPSYPGARDGSVRQQPRDSQGLKTAATSQAERREETGSKKPQKKEDSEPAI